MLPACCCSSLPGKSRGQYGKTPHPPHTTKWGGAKREEMNRDEPEVDDMKFSEYDPMDLQIISQRAGIASGEARRKKRAAIEREKIENVALLEQRRENIETLRVCAALLLEAHQHRFGGIS